jgi:hypothetical protein
MINNFWQWTQYGQTAWNIQKNHSKHLKHTKDYFLKMDTLNWPTEKKTDISYKSSQKEKSRARWFYKWIPLNTQGNNNSSSAQYCPQPESVIPKQEQTSITYEHSYKTS